MKTLAMASTGVFLLGMAGIWVVPFAAVSQCMEGDVDSPAEPQNVTDPEFVTIFNLKKEKQFDPLMEFRILIRAKSEGEAVMKSTILIQKNFGINALEILEFKEAAIKK